MKNDVGWTREHVSVQICKVERLQHFDQTLLFQSPVFEHL